MIFRLDMSQEILLSINYIKIIIFHLVPFPVVVFNIDNEQFIFYYDQRDDEKIYKDDYCVNHLFDIIPIFSSNEKDYITAKAYKKLMIDLQNIIKELE